MTQNKNVHRINSSVPTYKIGYGKPPVGNRFKPGQSGNPKGRKKNSKNILTLLRHELEEHVLVIENGKQAKLTKREIIVKQIVKKALKGDLKCLDLIIKVDESISASQAPTDATPQHVVPEE